MSKLFDVDSISTFMPKKCNTLRSSRMQSFDVIKMDEVRSGNVVSLLVKYVVHKGQMVVYQTYFSRNARGIHLDPNKQV